MKSIKCIEDILRGAGLQSKIQIFFSSATAGDDYDPYENNLTYSNLNPITIKGYVREISPEALIYKQYGLHQLGAKEILCDERYRNAFEVANKIVIDTVEYQVFKEGTGSRTLISQRPNKLIRVVVTRNG